MKHGNRTTMGGGGEGFPSTSWTQIAGIASQDQAQKRVLLGHLLGRYWKPVYCHLRRKGWDNESAKDLTQGFFQEVVLGRGLVDRADQAKGKFRTFLLTALDRYATDVHRRQVAERRKSDGMPTVQLDDLPDLPAEGGADRPDQAFNYAWATTILDEVLAKVETDCRRDGQAAHWEVFKARVVTPILEGAPAQPLVEVCGRLGIPDPASASNMIVTVKRKYRSALMETLAEHLSDPSEVEEELRDLIEALGKAGAR
jgi:DNA-directed RNA polymerase specialized sigma24 family protein